ncbi:hypothetical protein BDV26DRAFT_258761 [Aspergillus bertholletiae]|uniref:Uncharacterized protein n=1 Tax=Aspergillus bertholletiae TaxID=1226010 RepID=A0A5N7BDA2_9EURO|nr:hypothetical protein BDV26DRAFT_258761 [Aspergillus bertholletiae]
MVGMEEVKLANPIPNQPPVFSDLCAKVYLHPDVQNTTNVSHFGYHYGPIPGFRPAPAPGTPNPAEMSAWDGGECVVSRVHSGICWVDLGGGLMCGMTFDDNTSL